MDSNEVWPISGKSLFTISAQRPGPKQRSVRLLFFVTEKTSIPSFPKLFRLFCRRDPWDSRKKKKKEKGRGGWEKIKKNPGEGCFVKSYSRSWRAFVRRFMHPVSRRQFRANVPPFCCAMHSPDLFLRLSSIRKHLLFRRAMFKRVL